MEAIEDSSKTAEVKKLVKNATDLQRLKLERLMKNPVGFVNVFTLFHFGQSKNLMLYLKK